MTPHEVLSALWADGIAPRLTPDESGLVVPAGKLNQSQRAMLLDHKPELIAFLAECRATSDAVIAAAMRVCDLHGDSPEARAEMVKQCQEVPPHLQADLLAHFRGEKKEWKEKQ